MRSRSRAAAGVAALAIGLAAVLSACDSSGGSAAGTPNGAAGTASTAPAVSPALLAAARLEPCPAAGADATGSGTLPSLTLSCLGAGPAVDLASLTGTPAVVNLWASWCTDCQGETPILSAAHDRLGARVRFLGVDTVETSLDSALSFAAHVSPPMRYPSVLDPDRKLLNRYGLGLPVTLLADRSGKVVHVHQGAYTSAAAFDHDLATYLDVTA